MKGSGTVQSARNEQRVSVQHAPITTMPPLAHTCFTIRTHFNRKKSWVVFQLFINHKVDPMLFRARLSQRSPPPPQLRCHSLNHIPKAIPKTRKMFIRIEVHLRQSTWKYRLGTEDTAVEKNTAILGSSSQQRAAQRLTHSPLNIAAVARIDSTKPPLIGRHHARRHQRTRSSIHPDSPDAFDSASRTPLPRLPARHRSDPCTGTREIYTHTYTRNNSHTSKTRQEECNDPSIVTKKRENKKEIKFKKRRGQYHRLSNTQTYSWYVARMPPPRSKSSTSSPLARKQHTRQWEQTIRTGTTASHKQGKPKAQASALFASCIQPYPRNFITIHNNMRWVRGRRYSSNSNTLESIVIAAVARPFTGGPLNRLRSQTTRKRQG